MVRSKGSGSFVVERRSADVSIFGTSLTDLLRENRMKADLSRESFSAEKRYSRVILQQGRILTDADWNEQTSILLHHLCALSPARSVKSKLSTSIRARFRSTALSESHGDALTDPTA